MILLHFWKLLKFPDVIPSFCSLGDLQASLGQLCFSSVSFSCVIWCTLLHPITSYVIVNLRALAKHQDSVLHSLPWVHQLWHKARSHLLQTVLGSLQLICSCWEERLEGFQFKNNLRPRMERNNWNRNRVCLGRMEDSSLCRKFTHLVLHNQSFVSYILQNWHQIPLGSAAFLFFKGFFFNLKGHHQSIHNQTTPKSQCINFWK